MTSVSSSPSGGPDGRTNIARRHRAKRAIRAIIKAVLIRLLLDHLFGSHDLTSWSDDDSGCNGASK
jgi:hypothetical protein